MHFLFNFIYSFLKLQLHECWETKSLIEEHSCQKGLFLDRVLISPRTEKALAAAVIKLMAPMARVACGGERETVSGLRVSVEKLMRSNESSEELLRISKCFL